MEFLRTAQNPWGEEVLIGLAWDVAWLVVVLGAVFIIVHALFAQKKDAGHPSSYDPARAAAVPARVERHGKSARISHWILAVAIFALLITAFVPMLGLQFPWVTIHWIAGVVLAVYIVYHTVDTIVRLSWGEMWIGFREIGEAFSRTRDFFSRTEDPAKRPGKWGTENKVFHHMTALAGLGVVVTGILMMGRVDTWFWGADPYRWGVSDADWGVVFVIHGVTAVGFIGLLMAHLYFAFRPDKFWITKSMFRGWITKEEYLGHHNPDRWPAAPGPKGDAGDRGGGPQPAGAGAASGSGPMDRSRE